MRHQRGMRGRFMALSGIRKLRSPAGSTYPLLLVDTDGRPLSHLIEWFRLRTGPERTRTTYLEMLLPFTGFQLRKGYSWQAAPQAIERQVREFLSDDLACDVRPSGRNLPGYTVETTAATPLAESSVRVLLAALRDFYEVMREASYYPYANPMRSAVLEEWRRERARAGEHAGAPEISGIRDVSWREIQMQPIATFRQPKAAPWEPELPKVPEDMRRRLRAAILFLIRHARSRRDKVILQLLLHTGARLHEILHLTAGGLRAGYPLLQLGMWKVKVRNKGSRGKESKSVYLTDRLYNEILTYIRTDRARHDPAGRTRLEQLADADPIFLTRTGHSYNAPAFRYHWRLIAQRAFAQYGMRFTPHSIRHLVVTESMARIRIETKGDPHAQKAAKDGFARLMGWRGRLTIETYDHAFDVGNSFASFMQWQTDLDAEMESPARHGHAAVTDDLSLPTVLDPPPQESSAAAEQRSSPVTSHTVAERLDNHDDAATLRVFNFWED